MDDQTKDAHQEKQTADVAKDPTEKQVNADPYGVNLPTVYANDTNILVNPSDVSIQFSYNINAFSANATKPLVRVILSHDSFIKMMKFWATRSQFLESIYDNAPTSLLDILQSNPTEFNEAWNRFLGNNEETDK